MPPPPKRIKTDATNKTECTWPSWDGEHVCKNARCVGADKFVYKFCETHGGLSRELITQYSKSNRILRVLCRFTGQVTEYGLDAIVGRITAGACYFHIGKSIPYFDTTTPLSLTSALAIIALYNKYTPSRHIADGWHLPPDNGLLKSFGIITKSDWNKYLIAYHPDKLEGAAKQLAHMAFVALQPLASRL